MKMEGNYHIFGRFSRMARNLGLRGTADLSVGE